MHAWIRKVVELEGPIRVEPAPFGTIDIEFGKLGGDLKIRLTYGEAVRLAAKLVALLKEIREKKQMEKEQLKEKLPESIRFLVDLIDDV